MAQQAASYGTCEHLLRRKLEAMDEETYREILERLPELREPGFPEKETGEELEHGHRDGGAHLCRAMGCCCGPLLRALGDEGADGSYTQAELKLRLDLAAGKVSWYGEYWKDFWCWTRNCNPILAFCYSHPLHPVSRAERAFITILHGVFVMMISSLTPEARECPTFNSHACAAPALSEAAETAWVCCVCHRIGLTWFVEEVPFGIGGILYAVLVNTVFAQLMYTVGAGCICTQDRKPQVRRFWELIGHLFMLGVLLAMIVPTAIWLDYNSRHGMLAASFKVFFINKPVSILGTSVAQTLVFTYIWHKQKNKDALKESYQNFFVTALDYQALVKATYQKSVT